MSPFRYVRAIGVLALLAGLSGWSASAQGNDDGWNENSREVKHVFVIALENHNWTQPVTLPGQIAPIFQNPNAPFINSLVTGPHSSLLMAGS